jgi:hypothetical protein
MFKYETVKLKDLKPISNIRWEEKHYNIKDDVINNYDIKKGIITITKDNKILDGNHRYYTLLEHYGNNYQIMVRRVPIKKSLYLFLITPIVIILIPIMVVIRLFKKINKKMFK